MAGTYELSFCLKRNAASVVLTMLNGGDTQTLLDDKKKFELYALAVGMQKLSNFPYLLSAIAPYESPGETFTT